MDHIKAIYQLLCNGSLAEVYDFDKEMRNKNLLNKAHKQLGEDAEEAISIITCNSEQQGFSKGFKFAMQLMSECMSNKPTN